MPLLVPVASELVTFDFIQRNYTVGVGAQRTIKAVFLDREI